jgi:hypothetical protein
MTDLIELIGQTVKAIIGEDEKGDDIEIKCKIIHLNIEDYYFQDKGECIYIRVNVEPLQELPDGFDYQDCNDIYLDSIRKFY